MENNQGLVLVVDDNEDNRVVLRRRLERRGLLVNVAENGQKALEMLDEEPYDLVLLDIMMPVMNGFQVLEKMNARSELKFIPVIVISGLDDMDSIVKCIELGAEDYLLKPFNSTLLKARINASLEKKRLRDLEASYLQEIQHYNSQLENRLEEYLRELKMARRVQVSLLPAELPDLCGWEFAVRWFPAREIAGDYYDFIPGSDGEVNIVVGDVTDKGIPASLFMVFARNCVRQAVQIGGCASEVIRKANQLVCTDSVHGLHVPLVYASLRASGNKIAYVNAGQNTQFVYHNNSDEISELSITGMALGIEEGVVYEQETEEMQPGDFILFITDGVTDALAPDGEDFGADRLKDLVRQNRKTDAAGLISSIEQALVDHVGIAGWYDDTTILVVRKCV